MIKLLTSIAGQGYSHGYGETVELDKYTEERLIASGQAVAVKPEVKNAGKPKRTAAVSKVR